MRSFIFEHPPGDETLALMETRRRAEMPFALDLAFTSGGEMVVTDNTFHRVCLLDERGNLLKEFGLPGGDPGSFNRPSKVAVDRHDRIFVLDSQNRRVQVFDIEGEYLFDIGRAKTMVGAFLGLSGIAFMGNEAVIIADSPMATIQAFHPENGDYLHHLGDEKKEVDPGGIRPLWDVVTPAGLIFQPDRRRIWLGMPMIHGISIREVLGD